MAHEDEYGQEADLGDTQLRYERLDDFGNSLAKTRAEAIAGRQTSGIEEIWREDEEYYEGVDDRNRTQNRTNFRQKPPGQVSQPRKKSTRSSVFPNITGPFVEAASARISDMLLPTDDRAWKIEPTPVPELEAISDEQQEIAKGNVSPAVQQQIDAKVSDPEQADAVEQQLVAETREYLEPFQKEFDEAKKGTDAAQKRIEDWHVECQWHSQIRLIIEDSARIGTGVLKGPVPVPKRKVNYVGEGKVEVTYTNNPASVWVDPWNLFPDPACGENIHNGSYVWERGYITKKQLREFKQTQDVDGDNVYINEQIDKCIKEGPSKATGDYKATPDLAVDPDTKSRYEIWYLHGTAEKEDLEIAGCVCEEEDDPHMPALITMVNNHVIRAALNPLDTGDFPYDVFPWRRRAGHWSGIGVGRQVRVAQEIVVGGTRNLMDNAGLGAGPMLVMLKGLVPADGIAGIAPRKIWYLDEDASAIDDARKAIGQIQIDMVVDDLLKIIQFGMKLAEDTTGLPMLLQGQMGKAPDLVGVVQILDKNASSTLRRLAKMFDDRITEPQIERWYIWLLQYGPEDNEKGESLIDAQGSSALVERDIRNQELAAMGQLVLDPRFKKDPAKWMNEYLKSRHLDPKRFDYDDEEWQQVIEGMSQPAQDSSMEVATIRAQVDQYRIDSNEKIKSFEGQLKQVIEVGKLTHDAEQNERDRELTLLVESMQQDLAMAQKSGDKGINTDTLKTKLAELVMKIRSTEKLVGMKATADKLPKPPIEPPGKAKAGHSYQQ